MTLIDNLVSWSSLKMRTIAPILLFLFIVGVLIISSLKSNREVVKQTPSVETLAPDNTKEFSSPESIAITEQVPAIIESNTGEEVTPQQYKDEIEQLLAKAEQAFLVGDYLEPPGDNALAYYLDVLVLDPDNASALEGKQRVFNHFELANALTVYNSGNYSRAFKLLTPIASEGNSRAIFKQALLYYSGLGVPKDENKAMELIGEVKDVIQEKALNGEAWAETDLSRMYKHGWHVTKDTERSLSLLKSAASKNFASAQIYLGLAFIENKKYIEALQMFKKAAEKKLSAAQYYLGLMYQHGFGVEKDAAEAVKRYRKAAELGLARAQGHLGFMYGKGLGVSQDYAEAVKWYRKAAEKNDAAAQNNLGVLYELGRGVSRSYAEAMKWYRMAAEQNHATARKNLGRMYLNGYRPPHEKTKMAE